MCSRALAPLCVLCIVVVVYVIATCKQLELVESRTQNDVSQQFTQRHQFLDTFYRIPLNVVYVWCRKSPAYFRFVNYLSVRSAFQQLQPDRVLVYFRDRSLIKEDKEGYYYTWLQVLADQYPFFSLQTIDSPKWCDAAPEVHLDSIDEALKTVGGGIFLRDDAVVIQFNHELRKLDSVTIRDAKGSVLVRMMSSSRRDGNETCTYVATDDVIRRRMDESRSAAPGMLQARLVDSRPSCLIGPVLENSEQTSATLLNLTGHDLFPHHIWEMPGSFGRHLRTVAYDRPEPAVPKKDFTSLAPNVAHMIWTNDDAMPFIFYLSVLSLLEVVKVEAVYIHGNGPPTGRYWDLIKTHPRLRLVKRTLIGGKLERIYGSDVGIHGKMVNWAHIADVWRAEIMYRYGGLYVDTDAICFKPLDDDIRAYDAVLSYDIIKPDRNFPENGYQNGVMIGKPNKSFWKLFIESMQRFHDSTEHFLLNSCGMTYKIKELHPDLLKVDQHFQV